MNIINVRNATHYHGANQIFDNISLEIKQGEKVGLIGPNGSGKTTLMRLLAGSEQPSQGEIAMKKGLNVGYLEQVPSEKENLTVLEVLSQGLSQLHDDREEMAELERKMGDAAVQDQAGELERVLQRYAAVQERFEAKGGYSMEAVVDQIASGLDIDKNDYGQPFASLSGGEKTRVMLAAQLIVQPDVLLLDEPTNHLDLTRLEWLERYIREYSGTCIMISHDRYFLDRVVTRIVELEDGEIYTASGDYTSYMKGKEERLLQQFADFQEQQKIIKKMKESIKQLEEFGRLGGGEKFFKRAASMRKALERIEIIKRPVLERKQAAFDLDPQDRSGRRVVSFDQVQVAFQESEWSEPLLNNISGLLEYGEKAVLLGVNGSGKTTLFKVLLGEVQPQAGDFSIGASVDIGYLAQEEEPENPKQTVLEYFREQAGVEVGEARGILAKYLFFGSAVFKTIGALSGGEWTRLRLSLLIHDKPNLLLLDEPTNHLDIASREALEEALAEYAGTILAISHDRYFINRLSQKVWELHQGRLTVYHGNYDDYREKKVMLESSLNMDVRGKTENINVVRRDRPHQPNNEVITAQERSSEIEKEITRIEALIQAMNERLEADSTAGSDDHLATLTQRWDELEALQAKRDQLLQEWMECSE